MLSLWNLKYTLLWPYLTLFTLYEATCWYIYDDIGHCVKKEFYARGRKILAELFDSKTETKVKVKVMAESSAKKISFVVYFMCHKLPDENFKASASSIAFVLSDWIISNKEDFHQRWCRQSFQSQSR